MSIERQSTVQLQTLVSRLSEIGVRIEEIELTHPATLKLFLLACKLPSFPFGDREYVWYPLLVKPGETEIDRDKADAILPHLWHSSKPFFEDELESELEPENEREREIAAKVDAKARSVRDGHEEWGESPLDNLKASLTFEPSESECEYLEVRLHWRQDTSISN